MTPNHESGATRMEVNQGNDRVFVFDTTLRDGEQSPGRDA